MRTLRPLALATAAVLSAGLGAGMAAAPAAAAPAAAAPPAAAPPAAAPTARGTGLPATAVAQIDALARAKAARTASQRKVDSRLLAESARRRGLLPATGVRRVSTGVTVDAAGRTAVDVYGRVDAALLARIRTLGGRVVASEPAYGAVRADLPLGAVETLAAAPGLTRVTAAAGWTTGTIGPRPRRLSKQELERRVRARVAAALAARTRPPATTTRAGASADPGSVTSEGVAAHAVDAARATFQVSGTGVTVGVLSDGVDSLAASVASGDLPPDVRVLPAQAGSGDEGTAMLEIVHDLAPRARLLFATAGTSAESFAQNIRDLRAAGADILVDDVLYYRESPFQDGPIARAVTEVTAAGGLYFSSAGNQGNVDAGTAANYEGDFVSSGRPVGKFAGLAHDFDPGSGVQILDPLTPSSGGSPVILQWADPLGAAADDYDLYALDPAGNVVAFSNDVQDGNDDPFEGLTLPLSAARYRVAVVKFAGADRYLQLTAFGGRFAGDPDAGLAGYATPGSTRGHSAVPAAYSVAAAPAADPLPFDLEPGDPANPAGPFPGAFTAAQHPERFTADGPRRVFFHPDGTPVTPGDFSAHGGELRAKPDLTAADGVSTSLPDFTPFFGTSAAAPHAAGIAALVLSGNPGITPAEVRAALAGRALDIEAPGADRDTGAGIPRADDVLDATGTTPQPLAVAGSPQVTGSTDGDTFLEPGETATVAVPVTNSGDGSAGHVSVALSSTTPGVRITPSVRSYGEIAPDATVAGPPFSVTVPADVPLGTAILLDVKVSFVGAYSPQRSTARIIVGEPSAAVVDVAYAGPPVPIPDDTAPGASVPIPVSGVGPVSAVRFSVDGSECSTAPGATTVGIDHTFVGDLVGTLTAPDGTAVELFSRIGGSGMNICQAVFDDTAGRWIQDASRADAPFTASWRPEQPLAGLLGHDGDGTWTFSVVDNAAADTGSIRAVSLHLSGYVRGTPAGVPPR